MYCPSGQSTCYNDKKHDIANGFISTLTNAELDEIFNQIKITIAPCQHYIASSYCTASTEVPLDAKLRMNSFKDRSDLLLTIFKIETMEIQSFHQVSTSLRLEARQLRIDELPARTHKVNKYESYNSIGVVRTVLRGA